MVYSTGGRILPPQPGLGSAEPDGQRISSGSYPLYKPLISSINTSYDAMEEEEEEEEEVYFVHAASKGL